MVHNLSDIAGGFHTEHHGVVAPTGVYVSRMTHYSWSGHCPEGCGLELTSDTQTSRPSSWIQYTLGRFGFSNDNCDDQA